MFESRFVPLLAGSSVTTVEVSAMLYGVLAMVVGLIFLFFGVRMFRTVLATTGFIVASLVTFVLVSNLRESHSWGPHGDLYALILCIVVGVLGAVLGLSMWMLALVGIGALGGFVSALWLLSWKGHLLANPQLSRPLVMALATVLGGVLAIVYERGIIILGTSTIGAVALCSGVDVFAETGFNASFQDFLKNRTAQSLTASSTALLAGCAAVALLGIIVQATVTGRDKTALSRK